MTWASSSDNPEDTDLATTGNWNSVWDYQLIPVVELTVSSPFGGVLP